MSSPATLVCTDITIRLSTLFEAALSIQLLWRLGTEPKNLVGIDGPKSSNTLANHPHKANDTNPPYSPPIILKGLVSYQNLFLLGFLYLSGNLPPKGCVHWMRIKAQAALRAIRYTKQWPKRFTEPKPAPLTSCHSPCLVYADRIRL